MNIKQMEEFRMKKAELKVADQAFYQVIFQDSDVRNEFEKIDSLEKNKKIQILVGEQVKMNNLHKEARKAESRAEKEELEKLIKEDHRMIEERNQQKQGKFNQFNQAYAEKDRWYK